MIWRELANHFNDCYFCLTKIIGINKNNWTYPDLPSARRPVPRSEEIPIPLSHQLAEISENKMMIAIDCGYIRPSLSPQRFNQFELSDLIRDLKRGI